MSLCAVAIYCSVLILNAKPGEYVYSAQINVSTPSEMNHNKASLMFKPFLKLCGTFAAQIQHVGKSHLVGSTC